LVGTSEAGLIERDVTFAYDFRVRCPTCGRALTLTGADYLRLNDETQARMPCETCGNSIHFGPLTAAIRSEDDPALDDQLLNQMSWYHTSTYVDWPSPEYEVDRREELARSPHRRLLGDPERYLREHLDRALHLGTYEAAIENMYRRMRNQGDGGSTFYLHRVRVELDPSRVNSGFRDENDEPAAEIRVTDLADLGLDAVRYLNAWEASGCISLAVGPRALRDIQTIPLPGPLQELSALPPKLRDFIEELEQQGKRSLGTDEHEAYARLKKLEDVLVAEYLPDVNPVVSDDFAMALASQRRPEAAANLAAHACRFATHASLLTEPAHLMQRLNDARKRPVVWPPPSLMPD
jgi:hypothetical protein